MLVNRQTWPQHRRWAGASLAIVLAFLAFHFAEVFTSPSWPTGSSDVGLLAGIVAGGLILFEMGIWLRKKVRTWRRLGPAKIWMIAHIWFGLAIIPIAFIHSGWQFGGPLSTSLMLLLLAVVASGIFGLVIQQYVPTQMFEEVPAETIYSQIDNIVHFYRDDAVSLIQNACGVTGLDKDRDVSGLSEEEFELLESSPSFHVITTVQSTGEYQGKVFQAQVRESMAHNSPAVVEFFEEYIDPFLKPGSVSSLPLADFGYANTLFDRLRGKIDPKMKPVVNQLQEICDQRRQLIRQAQLHWLLHGWLLIHLPLSIALVAVLLAHAIVALRYM